MAKKANKRESKKAQAALTQLPEALGERAHDVWLAGLGALDRARKEGAEGFEALVKRGSKVRAKSAEAVDAALHQLGAARGKAAEVAKSAAASAAETVNAVEDRLETAVEAILARAGVPRRAEVEALTAQVDALQARIAQLTGGATVYRVEPHPDGWAVRKEGVAQVSSVHGTKREALSAGRALAKAHAPSRLVVHRADGSEQDTTEYGSEK